MLIPRSSEASGWRAGRIYELHRPGRCEERREPIDPSRVLRFLPKPRLRQCAIGQVVREQRRHSLATIGLSRERLRAASRTTCQAGSSSVAMRAALASSLGNRPRAQAWGFATHLPPGRLASAATRSSKKTKASSNCATAGDRHFTDGRLFRPAAPARNAGVRSRLR